MIAFGTTGALLHPNKVYSTEQAPAAGIWHWVPIDLTVPGKTALMGSCSLVQLSNRWGDEQQRGLAGTI